MTQAPLITVDHLGTAFGEKVIHKDLNLSVYPGEILGIVGGSGSGKSLLLRYMVGLSPPQKGKIIYHTTPPYPSTQIGVLFQYGALISSLSVLENIALPLREIAGISQTLAAEIALMKLDMVGLSASNAVQSPSELSGGMVKRVALARALALDPEILFLDEPTSGLDPIASEQFDALIQDLQHQLQTTIVMITHDLDSLIQICDRVGVLVDQNLVIGTVEEVAAIDHPWIHEYFHGRRGAHYFQHHTFEKDY